MQDEKVCWFCQAPHGLHEHHVFYGTANRRNSEKHGFKVWLCAKHHNMSDFSVHHNKEMDLDLKRACQAKFERTHSRKEFMSIIGRNYLDD